MEGDGGAVPDVLVPAGFGDRGRLDGLEACFAHVLEAVGDPVDVLLDRDGHVGQHRRAARPGDHEEVGESGGREPEVGGRAVGPLLRQGQAVAAGRRRPPPGRRSWRRSRWRRRWRRTRTTRLPVSIPVLGDASRSAACAGRRAGRAGGCRSRSSWCRGTAAWCRRVVLGAERLGRLGVVDDRRGSSPGSSRPRSRWTPGSTPWSAKTPRMANSSPCSQAASKRSRRTSSLAVTPRTSVGSSRHPAPGPPGRMPVAVAVRGQLRRAARPGRGRCGPGSRSSGCAGTP